MLSPRRSKTPYPYYNIDPEVENPKKGAAAQKVAFTNAPMTVFAEVSVAMAEGARKYGRHNYRRANIEASTYVDATMRHIISWWEGEDIDPDSGCSHIVKALASLTVMRDAMLQGTFADNRPPKSPESWMANINAQMAELCERYPDAKPALTELAKVLK